MKNLIKVQFLLLAIALIFTSCTEDASLSFLDAAGVGEVPSLAKFETINYEIYGGELQYQEVDVTCDAGFADAIKVYELMWPQARNFRVLHAPCYDGGSYILAGYTNAASREPLFTDYYVQYQENGTNIGESNNTGHYGAFSVNVDDCSYYMNRNFRTTNSQVIEATRAAHNAPFTDNPAHDILVTVGFYEADGTLTTESGINEFRSNIRTNNYDQTLQFFRTTYMELPMTCTDEKPLVDRDFIEMCKRMGFTQTKDHEYPVFLNEDLGIYEFEFPNHENVAFELVVDGTAKMVKLGITTDLTEHGFFWAEGDTVFFIPMKINALPNQIEMYRPEVTGNEFFYLKANTGACLNSLTKIG